MAILNNTQVDGNLEVSGDLEVSNELTTQHLRVLGDTQGVRADQVLDSATGQYYGIRIVTDATDTGQVGYITFIV